MDLYQVAGVGICKLTKKDDKTFSFVPINGGGDKLSVITVPSDNKKYRLLIDIKTANILEKRLNHPEERKISFKSNWRKREKLYQQKFLSLDPWQILEIIEELICYEKEKKTKNKYLTHMEKLWLGQSKKLLLEEIKVVLYGEKDLNLLCEEEAHSA